MERTIKLTKQDVQALRTDKGGFTYATVTALGMKWGRMVAGWPERLVGMSIPESQYKQAVAGRTVFRTQERNGNLSLPIKTGHSIAPTPATIDDLLHKIQALEDRIVVLEGNLLPGELN